jgi:lysophospholipase L1-like esterase
MFRSIGVVVFLVSLFVAASAQAQEVDPSRFESEINSFITWDRKSSFPEEAMLFVGSSSIRFWATAEAFPGMAIINRGFGGSHVSDVNFYFASVVKPYEPSSLFLYAGDNDIADGKSAERVLADFKSFVAMVEADSADTHVHYLSIKPSRDRWEYWPEMSRANQMIRDWSNQKANVTYVDMASVLLRKDGETKDVYIEDGLHLNELGYELWAEAISPYLD